MPCGWLKSKRRVLPILDTFYAQWRVQSGAVPVMRDDQDSPPERLLQAIWLHQRLQREQLKTLDGVPVRVLHPGFHNVEGGPDFRDAVVQLGDGPARTGDVEVDLRSSGWRNHGHDRNPAFRKVILHVIWESETRERPAGAPPELWLTPVLDAPLGELSLWLGGDAGRTFPEELRGRCCAPLRNLSAGRLQELLVQAAQVRLRSKAAQFQARARHVGWEQSLWEGLFRGLGYKHNVWPMQRLAELRPRWGERAECAAEVGVQSNNEQRSGRETGHAGQGAEAMRHATVMMQARLLGLSGLLPAELTRIQTGGDIYLRQVWDQWWRERDQFADVILPRSAWRLHGLRPANHPQRRLALAAAWSANIDLPAALEQWCGAEAAQKSLPGALLKTLQTPPDDFWSWHWTLRSASLKREQPLLGGTRITDLAVNVVLPWLWTRASEGKNEAVRLRIERVYFGWPPAQDNAVLRLARQRLLGGASASSLPTAAAQQGLLQIVRDFCDHSNSICQDCKLPGLVKEFVSAGGEAGNS